jgi:putative sigma-54 modulation protein
MTTRITARNTDLSDGLRAHIEQTVSKLDRYYDGIHDAHVVLEGQESSDLNKKAEVKVNVYRRTLSAQGAGPTYQEAVTGCVRQLRRQVLRYKDKIRSTDKDSHK